MGRPYSNKGFIMVKNEADGWGRSRLSNGSKGDRGVYTLIMRLNAPVSLKVGSLGFRSFQEGYYAYVGSALGRAPMSLRGRLRRHLSRQKRAFWHIDHFLRKAEVIGALASLTGERMECSVAMGLKEQRLSNALPVRGFGASDCRQGCDGHLFFFPEAGSPEEVAEAVEIAHLRAGLNPFRLL